MKQAIIVLTLLATIAAVACGEDSNPTGPSVRGSAALTSRSQTGQSTIAVLDGADPECNGACPVTKYPNYPAEPPSPRYFVQGYGDGCTIKWGSPWYTESVIYDDSDPENPFIYAMWCKLP